MNFPMDQPFYQFLYWLMNTPGVGGLIVVIEAALIAVAVGFSLRWIKRGAGADESETYAYPTPALHHGSGHPGAGNPVSDND
jgi:hypothetical protein